MVEPLESELHDPAASASGRTCTTEEDRREQQQERKQRQQEQVLRKSPRPAIDSIGAKAIAVANSEEFQIFEDSNHDDDDDDDRDSQTEWGSCVEYEEATPSGPQHMQLSGPSMMSLEAKLGLEIPQMRNFADDDDDDNQGIDESLVDDNSVDSHGSQSIEHESESSQSVPSSTGKLPISLRAPMNHDEMKQMSNRLEQRFKTKYGMDTSCSSFTKQRTSNGLNHDEMKQMSSRSEQRFNKKALETKSNRHEQQQQHSAHSFLNLSSSSGMNGTAHSKPHTIEVQLKTKPRRNTDSTSRENQSDDEDSESSGADGPPIRRKPFSSLRTNQEARNHINFGQEQSVHNRLGLMKSRWESMRSCLGESSNISYDDGSSSSFEESLSSDDDDDDDDEDDDNARKSMMRRNRMSSHSAPNSGVSASSSAGEGNRRGGALRSSAQSTQSAPDDRRAAMMQARKPSGNRMRALMAFKEATKSVRSNITSRENFNFRSIVRKSREIDMETGVTMTREFTAKRIDDEEFFSPMNPNDRRKRLFMKKRLSKKLKQKEKRMKVPSITRGNNPMNYRTAAKRNLFVESDKEDVHQYRLSSMIAKDDNFFFGNHLNLLKEYLYFCFRKSFIFVLATESMIFLAWCWCFAILYYILGRLNPQCIRGAGGVDFEEGEMGLVDAFTLSWTTFSTVGYGHIYPAIHGQGTSTRCIFITMLTSLQSFIGVLSASFCSAIIFAKIAKYQSIAHVMFSENVVIRFGQELMQDADKESEPDLFKFNIPDISDDKSGASGKSGFRMGRAKVLDTRRSSSRENIRYPCPIMEFRVVNLLHNESGGEIMNCKLNVVASTLEEVTKTDKTKGSSFFDNVLPSKQVVKSMQALQALQQAAKTTTNRSKSLLITTSGELMKRGNLLQKMNRTFSSFAGGNNPYTLDNSGSTNDAEGQPFKEGRNSSANDEYYVNVDEPFPDDESVKLENLMDEDLSSSTEQRKRDNNRSKQLARSRSIFVDEEPCGEGGRAANSRRVFSKVEIETDSHPFFKRVWNIRHILNENSPLLTEEARNVIRLNGGLWPATLCDPDVIHGCLEISQLIVSLSGTAVVSGSSVYKLHVYEREFVQIGKTFENPLTRDADGKLTIDMHLVSATKPQFEEKFSDDEEDEKSLHRGRRFSFRVGRDRR